MWNNGNKSNKSYQNPGVKGTHFIHSYHLSHFVGHFSEKKMDAEK